MPVAPTYPGVYVEEIPSGVRTITGVATSITAFVGRAKWGEESEPTPVFNFGEFEQKFGGLDVGYPMSYAVRDFFLNGGGQALIVRLFKATTGTGYAQAEHDTNLKLKAASPGLWGNKLTLQVNYEGIDYSGKDKEGTPIPIKTDAKEALYERYNLDPASDALFNIVITDTDRKITERFNNVTFKESARRLDRVLEQVSSMVRWNGEWPSGEIARPAEIADGVTFSGGSDSDGLAADDYSGSQNDKTGLYALEKADLFNLLCIPPDIRDGDISSTVYQEAMAYCVSRRAMLIADSPITWGTNKETAAATAKEKLGELDLSGTATRNVALFFPRIIQADPLRDGQQDTFAPCGMIAGIMARTDVQRGVWKAPAGIDAGLNGTQGLQVNLTDDENGLLNPLGINCLRNFPITGRVVWGARTLRGADQLADEWKYIPVRRLALYIEESLFRGLQWVVFEPNDEPLWAQIRLNVGAFMQNLFRQGAFQGSSPREAYFVKVDKETTTQNDINLGIVNIHVGFAPLKPAEFVILKLQQIAGQLEV